MDDSTEKNISDREALRFHSRGKPGKLEINPTKSENVPQTKEARLSGVLTSFV